jgi:two-component system KDP operon response regulator KdpE
MTSKRQPRAGTGAWLLLVEDDADTRVGLAGFLVARGFSVAEAGTGAEAWASWAGRRPDLVILDLGLPDLDGTLLIRRIRAEATTPVLVLSARHQEAQKIAALEAGADDYVTKPFGTGELEARIRALLRRAAGPAATPGGTLSVGPMELDVAAHRVTVDGADVHLTPREFEVLKVLVSHAGRVVTHGRLLRAVWGTAYSDEAHYVHVYVSQIRRKLVEADGTGSLRGLIESEPGVGYRVVIPT